MSVQPPASLKPVLGYLKKGDELDSDQSNPDSIIVAFACRQFAIEKGIKLKLTDPESSKFLMTLMTQLESDKKKIKISVPDQKLVCERFAFRVFEMADQEDRSGHSTKTTARTFQAASIFFEILEQFGEHSDEIYEKLRYSKFKVIDILKALKEGRTPTPGEPSEANETGGAATSEPAPVQGNLATFASVRIEDIPAAPVTQPFVMPTPPFTADNVKPQPTLSELMPKPGPTYVTTPATPSPSVLSAARPATVIASVPGGRMTVNDPRAKDAIELCNFAIASLKKNEVELAKERLREALRRLES